MVEERRAIRLPDKKNSDPLLVGPCIVGFIEKMGTHAAYLAAHMIRHTLFNNNNILKFYSI